MFYNKMVSVIIPNYNKRDYLEECITSVLRQTYDNIEIVVVDDCSTDDSRVLLKKLGEDFSSIKLVFLEKNGGVSNARNIGAQFSTGYYVTFLDSDDIYINDKKIENEVQIIEQDNDIAFSQWVPLDRDGKQTSNLIAKENVYDGKYAICKILSLSRPGYQQLRGYLLTRKLFDKVGGYSFPYNFYEDFDFQCRIVLNGKLRYTGEYGEGYRNVPGGLSKQNVLDSKQIIGSIQNKYYKELSTDQKVYYKLICVKEKIEKQNKRVLRFVKHIIRSICR